MVTMTVSLPDPMKDWIDSQVRSGDYATASDYVRDLVRRDRARRNPDLTLEDLRRLVADAKSSGVGEKSLDQLFAEAEQMARARGLPGV